MSTAVNVQPPRPSIVMTMYRTFASWRVGAVVPKAILGNIAFTLVLTLAGVNLSTAGEVGTKLMYATMVASMLVRLPRHGLLDMSMPWWKAILVTLFFSTSAIGHRAAAHAGDVYENADERFAGDFTWVEYTAATHGTAPLAMFDAITLRMRPGAVVRLRPSRTKVHAGGYVARISGDAVLEVGPGADHVSIVTMTLQTHAELRPGKYLVHEDLATGQIVVTAADAATAASVSTNGNAKVVVGRIP